MFSATYNEKMKSSAEERARLDQLHESKGNESQILMKKLFQLKEMKEILL